jgi:NTP pyrophosphatase (non-canonical NTP hydrolase)
MDLSAWQTRLKAFSEARDWEPFQNPKNLVMALSVEAAELLECYQWTAAEQALALTQSPAGREAVADEMADVLLYLLQLARVTGIDLEQAAELKLAKNALKYPALAR